jgi:hypothetical protein
MKKKDLYEVTIKILGIVAIYKLIEMLIACITVFITFISMSSNAKFDLAGVYQISYCILYVISIVLYGLFCFLFLFRTDKIIRLLKLTDSPEFTLQIEKKTIYHIAVLMIGIFMFAYSCDKLASFTYSEKSPANTEQTTFTRSLSTGEKVGTTGVRTIEMGPTKTMSTTGVRTTEMGPTKTMSTTVNFANILVLILSILIIIKSEKISTILIPKEKDELTV